MVHVHKQQRTSIEPATISKIQSVLSEYKYGIDIKACLSRESKFEAVSMNDYVTLQNYCINGSRRGVCGDLAVQAALELQPVIGNEYVIKGATGHCSSFDQGQHCFLLVWKKTHDAEIIKTLTAGSSFAEGVAIIDPSFNLVIPDAKNSGFILKNSFQVKENHFDPHLNLSYQNETITSMQPIGFIKEVIPQLSKSADDRSILFIGFERTSFFAKPEIRLAIMEHTGKARLLEPSETDKIERSSELRKFLQKIEDQLSTQAKLFPRLPRLVI